MGIRVYELELPCELEVINGGSGKK